MIISHILQSLPPTSLKTTHLAPVCCRLLISLWSLDNKVFDACDRNPFIQVGTSNCRIICHQEPERNCEPLWTKDFLWFCSLCLMRFYLSTYSIDLFLKVQGSRAFYRAQRRGFIALSCCLFFVFAFMTLLNCCSLENIKEINLNQLIESCWHGPPISSLFCCVSPAAPRVACYLVFIKSSAYVLLLICCAPLMWLLYNPFKVL